MTLKRSKLRDVTNIGTNIELLKLESCATPDIVGVDLENCTNGN